MLTVDVHHIVLLHRAASQLVQALVTVLLLSIRLCIARRRWRCRLRTLLRPCVADFAQSALQHFHEAMRVGVIVDGRSVAGAPAQDHQVEFPIAGIDQIASVSVLRSTRD